MGIRRVPSNNSNNIYPIQITCAGAVGKYVRVWLPGAKRIFDATVLVNRVAPVALPPSPKGEYCGAMAVCADGHGGRPCKRSMPEPECQLATPGTTHMGKMSTVKCCADSDITSSTPSGVRLGTESWVKHSSCEIWSNSICVDSPVGFREAEELCSEAGARLCTVAEVKSGCANQADSDTCQSNSNIVWSSDRCKNPLGVPCPKANDPPQLVCYGVEARTHSDASTPEFIISNDPMDPIFYSTCYVCERAVSFLPPPDGSQLFSGTFQEDSNETTTVYNQLADHSTVQEWEFNGQCLDCNNYDMNLSPLSNFTPQWVLGNQESCRDCNARSEIQVQQCSNERPAAPEPSKGPIFSLSPKPCSESLATLNTASKCFEAAQST